MQSWVGLVWVAVRICLPWCCSIPVTQPPAALPCCFCLPFARGAVAASLVPCSWNAFSMPSPGPAQPASPFSQFPRHEAAVRGSQAVCSLSWGLALPLLLQALASHGTGAPISPPQPCSLRQRRLMERGQAQQRGAKNFLCFQPPPSFFFFSFPLTISHSLFYIKPALAWLDCSAPLVSLPLWVSGAVAEGRVRLSHLPSFQGRGSVGEIKSLMLLTDAFPLCW